MTGSPQVATATVKATNTSAAKRLHVITAILMAINCFLFIFAEHQGQDREVIDRYSVISREIATGYRLTANSSGCVQDSIESRGQTGDESSFVPNLPTIVTGPCSTPHDVGFVSAQMAQAFRYRSLSPWTTLFTSMFLHENWMH